MRIFRIADTRPLFGWQDTRIAFECRAMESKSAYSADRLVAEGGKSYLGAVSALSPVEQRQSLAAHLAQIIQLFGSAMFFAALKEAAAVALFWGEERPPH